MRRRSLIAFAFGLVLSACGGGVAVAGLAGPGPWYGRVFVWGNDTGGIIPYSPDIVGIYREMAAEHCARWGRLSRVTSVHHKYGDYISFVCMDKPWMIH